MSKVVLNTVSSGFNVSTINANFDKVEQALNDKVLYRDNPLGEPNSMSNDLDMNGNRIYNLVKPVALNEPARLQDLIDAATGGVDLTAANVEVVDAGMYYTSGNVEGALQEIGAALSGSSSVLPDQVGNAGKYLGTDGTTPSWNQLSPNDVAIKRYRFKGNGQAASNQSVAFMTFYNSVPVGSVIYIDDIVSISVPLVLNRSVSIICDGASDGFWCNVGSGNDAIKFVGNSIEMNNLFLKINCYGPASACRAGVVFSCIHRSCIYVNCRIGAVDVATEFEGCLINNVRVESSTNYNPPVTGYGTQIDHMRLKRHVANAINTNINKFWVNLEGCRHGLYSDNMNGEGGNVISGCIEGLTGRDFTVLDCSELHITDLWSENNGANGTFTNCTNLHIGPGLVTRGNADYQFSNCKNLAIVGYYGGYNIASNCVGTWLEHIGTPDSNRNIVLDTSATQIGFMSDANFTITQNNHVGAPPMECIFVNPLVDLYDGVNPVTAGPPVGFSTEFLYSSGGANWLTRSTAQVYPGSPQIYSVSGISSGTTITNGCIITPGGQPAGEAHWVSVMIPIYCISPSALAQVYIDDGVTYHFIGKTTAINQWQVIRGSAKLIAGNNWKIRIAIGPGNGTYSSGFQYYIGGVNVVKGAIPPKYLTNSHARMNYVGSSITFAPFRQGAIAVNGGNIYMAVSNGAPSDWLKISP